MPLHFNKDLSGRVAYKPALAAIRTASSFFIGALVSASLANQMWYVPAGN